MIHILNYIKKSRLLWPIVLLGFIAHMAMIFTSGTYWCFDEKCGLYFLGVHGTDSVWHLALAEVSFNQWPFQLPVFAGVSLGGYNYLMDLVIFLLSKLGIPSIITFFKIFPVLWFVLFTSSVVRLARLIHDSKYFVALLLFLSYFCGSLAYLYTIWHHGTIWSSSGLAALQALHSLANMQYAFSLVILLEVLIIIIKDTFTKKEALLLGVFLFVALGLKFYGGVVIGFLIGIYLLTKILSFKKTSLRVLGYGLIIFSLAAVSLLLFYDPFTSSKTGAVFSFAPFATIHPTLESEELFYQENLVNARYALQDKFGPRLFLIESLTLVVFLVVNYGIRVVGVLYFLKNAVIKKVKKWEVLVFCTIIFATLLNILLIQKGEWWNTVQFLYYGIFLATIFTAQFLFSLFQKKNTVATLFAVLIILVSLPINIDLLKQFNSMDARNYVPAKELEALRYLKEQPAGVVFQPLYQQSIRDNAVAPFPEYSNYDSAYVAAFSGKQVLYSTNVQIRLVGVEYEKRLKALQNLDCNEMRTVSYAYIVKEYRDKYFMKCIDGNKEFFRSFDNGDVWIYSRNRKI